MKVLVIGQGGREHALVKAFYHSPSINEVHVLPGNDGMSKEAVVHPIPYSQTDTVIKICLDHNIDFVFIGPEDPLVAGLSDILRQRGILVVGPDQQAAQLEGSKVFAKEFMLEASIPTAAYNVVHSLNEVLQSCALFSTPYVLKADGLAAGKGVYICKDKNELRSAAEDIFEKKIFGNAGSQALLEQNLKGWELSVLVLTNGIEYEILPLAQDHKRLNDHDCGPNTGGMGTIAPIKIDPKLFEQIENDIVKPSVNNIHKRGYTYRGILFIGIMVTDKGPFVLEYNVRFGDPETQVLLPLIQNDLGVLFKDLSVGKLDKTYYKSLSACCVVLAAEDYPHSPKKGVRITGDIYSASTESYFIHAGIKKEKDHWVTNGGRVLCSMGLGSNLEQAIHNSYIQSKKILWPGMQFRNDIGKNRN